MNFTDPPAGHDHDHPTLDAPCLGCRCRALMRLFDVIAGHPQVRAKLAERDAHLLYYGNPDWHEVIFLVADAGYEPTRPPVAVLFRLIEDGQPVEYKPQDAIAVALETVSIYDGTPRPLGSATGIAHNLREAGVTLTDDEVREAIRRGQVDRN